ncbi:hypothetical protein J6590_055868 [Homalodisca vitripennis]|nr:hypothetical protein J6590_055868 [Homalodisca vitripennis]
MRLCYELGTVTRTADCNESAPPPGNRGVVANPLPPRTELTHSDYGTEYNDEVSCIKVQRRGKLHQGTTRYNDEVSCIKEQRGKLHQGTTRYNDEVSCIKVQRRGKLHQGTTRYNEVSCIKVQRGKLHQGTTTRYNEVSCIKVQRGKLHQGTTREQSCKVKPVPEVNSFLSSNNQSTKCWCGQPR